MASLLILPSSWTFERPRRRSRRFASARTAAGRSYTDDGLGCGGCGRGYELDGVIPILVPEYDADVERRQAYLDNYERMARARTSTTGAVPGIFDLMHSTLIEFVGDVRGKRVLDLGSAYGSYRNVLDAELKVAGSASALPALRRIPPDSGIVPVCGDAEFLPIREDFDVVIISDSASSTCSTRGALVARLTNDLRPSRRA